MARLSDVEEGASVRVRSVPGGGVGGLLRSRGIMPGAVVRVLSNPSRPGWSPVVVEVRGARVAVGRDVARLVEVEYVG